MTTKQSEIGIGQCGFTSYRYKLVDYLPWMYVYEFPLRTRLPTEKISYWAIVRPFGAYVWLFTFLSLAMVYLTLVIFQKLWANTSGETYILDYLYQGK